MTLEGESYVQPTTIITLLFRQNMLRRTLVRSAKEARQPLIKFPDRKASHHDQQHTPHPHPAAPQDVANDFEHFQKVFASGPHFQPEKIQKVEHPLHSSQNSESKSPASNGAAEDLHDLPKRFWQTPALAIEEKEMDAIMVRYKDK